MNAGEELLRRHGAVPSLGRTEADVAVAARPGVVLAEIGQQGCPPASGDLAPAEQRIEPRPLNALVLLVRLGLVGHLAQPNHILQAIAHPGRGGQPIAAGAPGLLIVGLHALWQISVGHEAHVRLVDAHAEGDGGDDDHPVVALKAVLMAPAHIAGQPRVIGQRVKARLGQLPRRLLDLAPRQAIDDARLVPMAVQKRLQVRARATLHLHPVANVGPVKAADEAPGLIEPQTGSDLPAGAHVRRGGKRHARHAGKVIGQYMQAQVVLTKVVPPLGDAMGLVNGNQRHIQSAQQFQGARLPAQQPLRRQVQQVEFATLQGALDLALLVKRHTGVEERRGHPELAQCLHLVLHQRNQWRDDDAHSPAQHRRNLVAQRLAAAGRHQHQRIPAIENGLDDLELSGAKRRVAVDAAQQRLGALGEIRVHERIIGRLRLRAEAAGALWALQKTPLQMLTICGYAAQFGNSK